MIALYTEDEFVKSKGPQLLLLKCKGCGGTFLAAKSEIKRTTIGKNGVRTLEFCSNKCIAIFKASTTPTAICNECGNQFKCYRYKAKNTHNYCSRRCYVAMQSKIQTWTSVLCLQCGIAFKKATAQLVKYPKHFCSKSCAAKYGNANKIRGNTRSKLETWLEANLAKAYPTLTIKYNDKSAIGAELDIFIPQLKLAFELNGPFHYEPVFNQVKFERTQEMDKIKFKLCHENGIGLCVLNTTDHVYSKPKHNQKFMNIISNIVNECLLANGCPSDKWNSSVCHTGKYAIP